MKHLYLPLIIACLLMANCRKENPITRQPITVTGKLLKNCDGAPEAGYTGNFYYKTESIDGYPDPIELNVPFTTDSTGAFTIPIEVSSNRRMIQMQVSGPDNFAIVYPDDNYNLGSMNLSDSNVFYIVRLKVTKAFSSGDIVWLSGDGRYKLKSIKPPFTNGQLVDTIAARNQVFIDPSLQRTYLRLAVSASMLTKFSQTDTFVDQCSKYIYVDVDLDKLK